MVLAGALNLSQVPVNQVQDEPIKAVVSVFRTFHLRPALCIAGLLFCTLAGNLQALDPLRAPSQYRYDEWNMTHGLPYSAVRGIYQSSDGYLWLATRAGISRFDSVSFTNFTTADMGGISVDEVTFFAEDTRNRLWVGTRKGVIWYEHGVWSQATLGPELEHAEITGLLPDGDGMYVATRTQVLRWEKGRASIVDLGTDITLNWYFESLHRAKNGDLIVTGDTLVRIKKDGGREILDRSNIISKSVMIRAFAEDRSGGIWLGTPLGLYLWKDKRLERLPDNNGFSIGIVRSLCIDKDENLWIGTTGGLFRYSAGKLDTVYINGNETLSHILYIREDTEGNLWCGTDAGLMRLHDVKIANLTIHDGLPTSSIQTIIKARDGGTWIATLGGGVVRMKPDGLRIHNLKTGLADNSPMILFEDSADALWIGYYSTGIDRLQSDGTIEHHKEVNGIVSGMVELSPGDIWAATWENGGLYRLSNGVFEPTNALNDVRIRSLIRDSKGRLWAAWERGVAIYENGKWTRLEAPADMGEKMPTVFHEHSDGSMWLLRDGFELQRFQDGKLQRLVLPEVAGRLAYGLAVREGEVWLSLRNGVLRAKLADLEAVWNGEKSKFDYTLYNESDGMRSPAPNNGTPSSILDLGPEGVWVATTKGIAVIQPEHIRINKIPPNVIVESIVADRRSFVPAPTVQVPAGRGELAIRFTALSLGDPVRVLFKYRLDGFDRDWVDTRHQREAHYGGLPPGAYQFRVVACNEDGLWNETGASCKIVIAPHLYQTWWFWTVGGLAVAGLFGLFLWFRTSQLRHQQRELIRQVEERTKDLKAARDAALAASKAKSEFVANMSHEIRTPMNGVIGLTELALNLATNKEQASYLKTVLHSSDALMTVINGILDFAKIESGKLTLDPVEFPLADCVQSAIEAIAIRAAQKRLELLCAIDPQIPSLLVGDNARLRQVLLNILGNAVKFTERGHVSLNVSTSGGDATTCPLHFCVSDSGIGIAANRIEHIFQPFVQADSSMTRRFGGTGLGLTISQQLVSLMGGKIWVESESGRGSRFHIEITLPVPRHEPPAPTPDLRLDGPVLVIEDHPQALNAIEKLLAEFQIDTLPAHNADQAATCLHDAKIKPALLIVDEQLGDDSGYDVIELLRKAPGCAKLPTLLLLASDRPADLDRCAELGIDFKLRKPVFRRSLLDQLKSIRYNIKKPSTSPLPIVNRVRSLNVLVAEDTAVNQLVARKMLELGGHKVEIVCDGKQAVEHFRKGNYDLILMDVQMPELDGREATGRIRQLEAGGGKHIPIIALTAHAMKGDADLCLAAGMDGYLTKPLKRRDLNDALERFFLPAQQNDTVATANTNRPGSV